jgi:voltage-gated potassium channel
MSQTAPTAEPAADFEDPGAPLPEMSRRERAGVTYARFADPVMFLVALLFLLAFLLTFVPNQTDQLHQAARTSLIVTWLMFVIDYFIRTFLAPSPVHYMTRHPLVLLSLFIPPLRAVLALRALVVLLRGSQGQRTGASAQIAFWLVITAVLYGSVFELWAETSDPNAEIKTYGQALWWSFETVSTVGYGDLIPQTFWGRFIAVCMMIVGVGLISTVSATIASGLIQATQRDKRKRFGSHAQKAAEVLNDSSESNAASGSTDSATPAVDPNSDDFKDDPAVATLAALVAAVDRLQTEVAALRSGHEMSDASVTNVTSETTENSGDDAT